MTKKSKQKHTKTSKKANTHTKNSQKPTQKASKSFYMSLQNPPKTSITSWTQAALLPSSRKCVESSSEKTEEASSSADFGSFEDPFVEDPDAFQPPKRYKNIWKKSKSQLGDINNRFSKRFWPWRSRSSYDFAPCSFTDKKHRITSRSSDSLCTKRHKGTRSVETRTPSNKKPKQSLQCLLLKTQKGTMTSEH